MRIAFDDQVVFVTGAARGIGAAIVAGFLDAGAKVTAADILEEELEALARLHPDKPLITAALDLADDRAVRKAVGSLAPDVVIHVAGGVRGQSPRPIEEVTDDDWMAIYDSNVMSALHVVRAVVPSMKARGSGRIVTISSGAGLRPSLTGIQSYCSAKHGLIGLTRQLALELGPHGITCNSVAPGFLRTSPDYERQWQSYGSERQKRMLEGIAMRRLGEPEDIASAVLFLSSSQASWITGQVLPVTGHPFP
ncbi:SDR family NAD(P)-dependent oxidoreductase [Chelativorans sp. AA-79]|uniref:SDR family NAD(P)-dependent oxidoreductase n=1 Tax=Chelativorans sp. AA-79 TaxID=3028735 RepID=UPI0023FA299C|nr:SDR family NAD(P)-dependent oxidoreductase [Chelativorans sp. AA-79]WEX12020.1 SDR family NAD(P)-dependent oxidoreductase [Chelativorans sp. AA-79]